MIAATALAHALPVYTCNPDNVTGIDGLEVVAVPVPARSRGRCRERRPRAHRVPGHLKSGKLLYGIVLLS